MDIPTYPQAVLGWRVWEATPQGELKSVGAGCTMWRKGENTAYCGNGDHHAPHEDCDCGFNLYHTLEDALAAQKRGCVVGACVGWGESRVHSTGVRVEKCRVIAILDEGARAGTAAQAQGVPLLKSQEEIQNYALVVASPAPEELRPKLKEDASQLVTQDDLSKSKTLITTAGLVSFLIGCFLTGVSKSTDTTILAGMFLTAGVCAPYIAIINGSSLAKYVTRVRVARQKLTPAEKKTDIIYMRFVWSALVLTLISLVSCVVSLLAKIAGANTSITQEVVSAIGASAGFIYLLVVVNLAPLVTLERLR